MDALSIDPFDFAMGAIALNNWKCYGFTCLGHIEKAKQILDKCYGKEYNPYNLPLNCFANKAMEKAICGESAENPIEFMRHIYLDLGRLCEGVELPVARIEEIGSVLYTFGREVLGWKEYMYPTRPWL